MKLKNFLGVKFSYIEVVLKVGIIEKLESIKGINAHSELNGFNYIFGTVR